MAQTITVRGEGGHVFDMDVPADGTVRRKVFDRQVARGELRIVSGTVETDAPAPVEEPDGPPALKAKVSEWRDYAVSQGHDPDEVATTTKKELIALFASDDEDDESDE